MTVARNQKMQENQSFIKLQISEKICQMKVKTF